MSNTWNTDPLWVRHARSGVIDHDHRRGECILTDGRNLAGWNHLSRCPRSYWTTRSCEEAHCYQRYVAYRDAWMRGEQLADDWTCGRDHKLHQYDPAIACEVCEAPRPTCWPNADRSLRTIMRYLDRGCAPGWFVTLTCHKPARARVRESLTEARKAANAGAWRDEDWGEWEPEATNYKDARGWWW